MAIIPADEKVFMVDKRTNTTYGGSQALQDMQQWYTMQDVSDSVQPYKVFTALLTQSGTGDELNKNSGALTQGVTYRIDDNSGGADFTNVGAPNNNTGTRFIANANIEPNNYGTGNLTYNTGAPVATVLENTIGNVWFTYLTTGNYGCFSDDLFLGGKTFVNIPSVGSENSEAEDLPLIVTSLVNSSFFNFITTLIGIGTAFDGALYYSPIEIRVYN